MNYILAPRFNMIDSTAMIVFGILFAQGEFLQAVMMFLGAVILSSLLQHLFGKHAKDKEWQSLADTGQKVAAIKRHRQLYKSSLKEALDAVDAYTALKK